LKADESRLPVMAVGGKIPAMLLVIEVAAGVLLALGIWQLPTIYRRRKMRNIYLNLSSAQVLFEATKADMYTNDQTNLLIQLSLATNQKDRESLASQLADSFAP
jgi:hypothetical protein